MTEPAAAPPPDPIPDDPRRLAQADLVRELLSGLMAQAAAFPQSGSRVRSS